MLLICAGLFFWSNGSVGEYPGPAEIQISSLHYHISVLECKSAGGLTAGEAGQKPTLYRTQFGG